MLFSPGTSHEGDLPGVDKVVHAVVFLALAVTTRRRFGRGLLPVLGYALVSEVLQHVLPLDRHGSPADALADASGAVTGWWLARARS